MKIMDPSSKHFVQDEGHYWNNGRRPSFCLPAACVIWFLPSQFDGFQQNGKFASLKSEEYLSGRLCMRTGH
ncbi:MAG: hypothetical protein N0C90_22705, partial [Candidatus Thiodiazotropha endolucinida]|nr:hypothetical protein [Candidatus Thiodiazotropha taylori]MCW4264164.1 hypothetical protein [Candidatus Thiodiazotropha endolucinida]